MIDMALGDRASLSLEDLSILETEVLPRAKRWLKTHGLDEHAVKTLSHWGEPFDMPDRLCRREAKQ